MAMYSTYIIQSTTTGHYYIGSCENVQDRLLRHNRGDVRSTKSGIPWKIVYAEKFAARQEAYRRERQMKSYKGGTAFRRLFHSAIT